MKGMVSRKLVAALVVLMMMATLAVMFSPVAGATRAPRYVECTSTIWVTVQTQTYSVGPQWAITAHQQILKDARDFSFCSQFRNYTTFVEQSGYCDTFYADVVDMNNVHHARNSVYACANGGSFYSFPWSGSCASVSSWDYLGYVAVGTIGGCY